MVIAGVVATAAVGAYGASKASSASNKATDAASASAATSQKLAQDEWDYQKNVYLPAQQKNQDAQLALTKEVADKQMAEADQLDSQSATSFAQAQKSYKYQDQYDQMTDDYASGKTANTMADEAGADSAQAYAGAQGSMARNAARYGINPGSGAYAAAQGDLATNEMLSSAGGQTAARRAARDKAEQMVGIAAGSGTAGFGTGLSAAGLATGANAGAVGAGAAGTSAINSGAAGYGSGMGTAGSISNGSAGAYTNIAGAAGNSPLASFSSGLLSSGLKAYGANKAPGATGLPTDDYGYATTGVNAPNELTMASPD